MNVIISGSDHAVNDFEIGSNQVVGVQRCIVELPDTSHPSEIISSYETANNACEPISGGPPTVCTRSIGFRGSSGYYCQAGSTVLFTQVQVRRFLPGDLPCRGTLTLKLSRPDGSSEDNIVLDKIEPAKEATLVAKVYDQNNQLVPNVGVKLVLEAKQNSGGHHHPDDTVAARTGTMQGQQMLTGNTGPNGLQFSYKAPGVAGDYKIVASCTDGKNCQPEGADTVWVGVKGLQPVGDNAVYRLIPNAAKDPGHPNNHYLTLTATSRIAVLATLYHAKYPNLAVLYLNDASLERGGIFDLNHNWKSPHFEHCRGAVIDVRANGAEGALDITSDNDPMIKKFQGLTSIAGADALWDVPKDKNKKRRWELRHFHIRLLDQEGLQCP